MSEITPLEHQLISELKRIAVYLDNEYEQCINKVYGQNYHVELQFKGCNPVYILTKDGSFAANFYTFIEVISYLQVCRKVYHKRMLEANTQVKLNET